MSHQELRAELSALVEEVSRRAERIRDLQRQRLRAARVMGALSVIGVATLVLETHLLTLAVDPRHIQALRLAPPEPVAPKPVAPVPAAPAPNSRAPEAAPAQSVLSLPAPAQPEPPSAPPEAPPVAPEALPASPSGPVAIDALPYSATGDTRGGAELIAVYSCAPGYNESGPERTYTLAISAPGTLTASVSTSGADADVDVHLLSGPTGQDCLARGDRTLSTEVSPGNYLVVVDTFVSPVGVQRPGPFTLSVSLATPATQQAPSGLPTDAPAVETHP